MANGAGAALTIIVQLIFLEGILSLDNAAVLGAMVTSLPADRPVPWPHWFRRFAGPATRFLGMQRAAALKVGLLGAYIGRGLLLLAATVIAHNPWMRLIGAAYLLYLGLNHIANQNHHADPDLHLPLAKSLTNDFWTTVLAIEFADLAFSLDNVVAAAALSTELWVLMVGVGLGIIAMRFAAGLFGRVVAWEPALETGAYILVLAIGVELIVGDIFAIQFATITQFVVSIAILIGTVLVARSPLRQWPMIWHAVVRVCRVLRAPFLLITLPVSMLGRWLTRTETALHEQE